MQLKKISIGILILVGIAVIFYRKKAESLFINICNTDCGLVKGDILVRRKLTTRNYWIEKGLNLYMTHAALYLGDGEIAEAGGYDKDNDTEVQTTEFKSNDWYEAERLVIIRPLISETEKSNAIEKAREIAGNNNFVFGLDIPGRSEYQLGCVDFVTRTYAQSGIFADWKNSGRPDDLLKYTMNRKAEFRVFSQGMEEPR